MISNNDEQQTKGEAKLDFLLAMLQLHNGKYYNKKPTG